VTPWPPLCAAVVLPCAAYSATSIEFAKFVVTPTALAVALLPEFTLAASIGELACTSL
jgi:hypothetical protein